jgi:uncharacterized BrkB/YihY/UPF0761 family membrane protein
MFAYNAATLPQLVVWSDHHQRTFTRADSPALFWIPAFAALTIAAVCSFVAYHLHFRAKLSRPAVSGPAILRWVPFILPGIALLLLLAALIVYYFER